MCVLIKCVSVVVKYVLVIIKCVIVYSKVKFITNITNVIGIHTFYYHYEHNIYNKTHIFYQNQYRSNSKI